MTLQIGIIGLGFMGRCHFETWAKVRGARLAAVCDIDPRKRAGDWSGTAGNLGGSAARTDLSGLRIYARAEEMFADPDLDVVDITLPTYLHAEYAVAALRAGKHVICEKPMARTSTEARRMQAAAKAANRQLCVAQCIRFWPAYAVAAEQVRTGKLGLVVSATFRRVSPKPTWSWKNWLMDETKSGGCVLDLHIHDADFVLSLFGPPQAVSSQGSAAGPGGVDHVITSYRYADGKLVTAEGAWEHTAGFPFSMTFVLAGEKASLTLAEDGKLRRHDAKGTNVLPVPEGDGYLHELQHFAGCLARNRPSSVVPPGAAAAGGTRPVITKGAATSPVPDTRT